MMLSAKSSVVRAASCSTRARATPSGSKPCSAVPSTLPRQVAAAIQLQQTASRKAVHVARAQPEDLVDAGAGFEEPESAAEANTLGLKYTAAGKWTEALTIFEKALKLPGTGIKRFRDKPREPSDRERMTSLYNIACCHSQLGDVRSGLVALAGCMELGYADFAQIRRDPDLAALRKDERFEGLIKRFEPQGGLEGLFGFKLPFGGK